VHHVQLPSNAEGIRTRVKENDLLICITGALTGNVVLVDADLDEAYVNQHVALVRPRLDAIEPKFLAYCLYSRIGQLQFKSAEYGGTKQGLGLDEVKSTVIPVPPRREQAIIVNVLDEQLADATNVIEQTIREISLVREYRTRLIADVVTGKLDVRDAAVNLPDELEKPAGMLPDEILADSAGADITEDELIEEEVVA
jgi:type I restriction enzyme S subunit